MCGLLSVHVFRSSLCVQILNFFFSNGIFLSVYCGYVQNFSIVTSSNLSVHIFVRSGLKKAELYIFPFLILRKKSSSVCLLERGIVYYNFYFSLFMAHSWTHLLRSYRTFFASGILCQFS